MSGDDTRDSKARADALRRRISQRQTPAGAEPDDAASGPKAGESPLAYTERRSREIAKKTDPPIVPRK
ncbi:MAG: hypothetical protein U0P30_13490 [Vicinamibacterales bacterium]